MPEIKSERMAVLMLQTEKGSPVGCVVRVDNHYVFYSMKEMSEEDIADLFKKQTA